MMGMQKKYLDKAEKMMYNILVKSLYLNIRRKNDGKVDGQEA